MSREVALAANPSRAPLGSVPSRLAANRSVAKPQRTLAQAIHCYGVGVHSGARARLVLEPGPVNSGVRFRRDDLDAPLIEGRPDVVTDTTMCTRVGDGANRVATVEHVLAALAAMEIDNCVVAVDGPEIPIMDGSAEPFVFLIERAGVVDQDAPRRFLEILRPIVVEAAGKHARLEPFEGQRFDAEIRFDHPLIERQSLGFDLAPAAFKRELAGARTFGFAKDIEELRARGLARGGSLENAVVVGPDRVLNPEGLRCDDEFVRHKILDAVGDLYLAGGPIWGRYVGFRAGHMLHNKLLRAVFAQKGAWRWSSSLELGRGAAAARRAH